MMKMPTCQKSESYEIAMGVLQLAVTWYMLEGKLPTGTSKTKRLHQEKFEFSLGAFFWDYSGIGILGIDGICVLLGAIPFSE